MDKLTQLNRQRNLEAYNKRVRKEKAESRRIKLAEAMAFIESCK